MKIVFIILILIIIISLFVFERFSESAALSVTFIIIVLALLAWLKNILDQKNTKQQNLYSKNDTPEVDDEYHNDFSKVPAGEPDPIQPPPRSIGYGYGDGGRSVIEDLERIGITDNPEESSELNIKKEK
ncbi:MAG: hypothetical protein K2Q18_09060 [Bdellovibrionales bacterium]|nr:hypothetical protein [Bdellovibrionales bacterium]